MTSANSTLPVTRWLRTLWLWWAISSALILGLGILAFVSHADYSLKAGEAALLPRVQRLSGNFAAIATHQGHLLRRLDDAFHQHRLTLKLLQTARSQAQGMSRFYAVSQAGVPVCPGDDQRPPDWLLDAIRKHPPVGKGVVTLMPVRPEVGITIGDFAPPAILRVRANDRHQWLIGELNVDELLGPWLQRQLPGLGLPPGYALMLGAGETDRVDRLAPDAPAGAWSALLGNGRSTLTIDTAIPDSAGATLTLLIRYDPGAAVRHLALLYGLGLVPLVPLMGGFALALRLASRSADQEMQLAEDRTNFTAMVSHELKTPIAAIRMYAEILENQLITDPDKIADYHRIIGTEVRRLGRLIDNLLDLAKIQRRQRRYRPAPVAVASIIERAVDLARKTQGPSAPPVAVSLDPDLPALRVDAEAAVQAVTNLIHNAFKYGGTPPEVTVHVRVVGVSVAIDVMDRGPGIADDDHAAIFDPYVRLEDEATRQSQGSGLGLALVKAYVEDHGGRVGVAARPGGGSIFSLILPASHGGRPDAVPVD